MLNNLSINTIIIIATAIVSFIAFSNRALFHKLKFNPYYIKYNNEWYRFFTGGIIHGDIAHLLFNMMGLWFAGQVAEQFFQDVIGNTLNGSLAYLLFYIIAIPISSLYSFAKNKDNEWYSAIGASGAVSAVLVCFALLNPGVGLLVFFIPMPAWVFVILYLIGSWYMARKGTNDNIGHDAHFFGAVFGLFVTIILRPSVGLDFIDYIRNLIPL